MSIPSERLTGVAYSRAYENVQNQNCSKTPNQYDEAREQEWQEGTRNERRSSGHHLTPRGGTMAPAAPQQEQSREDDEDEALLLHDECETSQGTAREVAPCLAAFDADQ